MSDLALHVAIVADQGHPLDACLGALIDAGATRPSIHHVAQPTGAFPGGVQTPLGGLDTPFASVAVARNAALAAAGAAEVIAYVDGDVVVEPGWLEALHDAWTAPGAQTLGAVGGPLRPSFPDGRPAWLTNAALGVLGLQDHGPEPHDLDPATDTLHGGNLSFRAAALRGVAGFWPARGHADARDLFSHEHNTQRDLAAVGWRVAWAPAAAAERRASLGRAGVLRRRLRAGARGRLIGGEEVDPAATARRALITGAGTALALRRPGVAMERAGRCATAVGTLLGGMLAAADLQPVARSTPFSAVLPPAQPHPVTGRLRHARREARTRVPRTGARGLVLLYHRVAAVAHDPLGLAVAPAHFAEHLEVLGGRVGPLEAVAAGEAEIAITFDDGYVDARTHALPALAATGLPATLFVATGSVRSGAALWWDAVDRLLRCAPGDAGPLRIGDRAWNATTPGARAIVRRWLQEWLQPAAPSVIARALLDLATWARGDRAAPDADRPLTVPELRALAAAGPIALGAHTRTHRSLAHATEREQRDEIARSGDDLAAWTGRRPTAFSYPFGVPGADVPRSALRLARELGYTHAVLNAPGRVSSRTDPFALPRVTPPAGGGSAFAAWLHGWR